MKLGVIAVAVIVAIAAVAGWAIMTDRPAEVSTPAVSDSELSDGENGSGFVQVAPTDLPLGAADSVVVEESAVATAAPTTTDAPTASGETVLISMDETGFAPSSVTINVGDTVTFVNDGQAKHWPASDLHPTHEILPDFDSNRGLETGEDYSHTFTKAGTWNCHDHLAPRLTCAITVE